MIATCVQVNTEMFTIILLDVSAQGDMIATCVQVNTNATIGDGRVLIR